MQPGDRVKHYEIVKLLGSGGMGTVYMAFDMRLERPVALKFLNPGEKFGNRAKMRFVHEAQAASSLDHPNICTIHEIDEYDGRMFICMAYYNGRTVGRMLEDGPLSVPLALNYAIQTCYGLMAAHGAGIIHRDIKPDNLMVRKDGLLKILDFGLARLESKDTDTEGLVFGTIKYMSPEQMQGRSTDPRCDIWAMGVVLYEMLTGAYPFSGVDYREYVCSVLMHRRIPLSSRRGDLPEGLEEVVNQCLEMEPAQRPADAESLLALLKSVRVSGVSEVPVSGDSVWAVLSDTPCEGADLPEPLNFPVESTEFVGRDSQLTRLSGLIRENRCVVALGPGGVGKTRLACRCARANRAYFPGGVYFVDLTRIDTVESFGAFLAESIGCDLSGADAPLEQVIRRLAGKRSLLVLDNCEHLPRIGEAIQAVYEKASRVSILATSRTSLRIRPETIFELEGLDYPAHHEDISGNYAAVELFVQTARRMEPEFAPSADDMVWINRICAVLEGLPLGIELASGWIRMLTCEEIFREIGNTPAFLRSDSVDVPERHRSLEAVFDTSWRLLSEADRRVVLGLSLFQSGFSRDAARAVTGVTLDGLRRLMDCSFIGRQEKGRYRMHSAIRLIARDRLRAFPRWARTLRKKYCEYFLGYLQAQSWGDDPAGYLRVLENISRDRENILAAIRETFSGGLEIYSDARGLQEALDAMFRYFFVRSRFHEGVELASWLMETLDTRGGELAGNAALRVFLLFHRGKFSFFVNDYEDAKRGAEEALAICRERNMDVNTAENLDLLGNIALFRGELDRAEALYREALALRQKSGRDALIARSHLGIGHVAFRRGDFLTAMKHFEKSLSLGFGDVHRTANCLNNLGSAAFHLGWLDKVKDYYGRSLEIREQIEDRNGMAVNLLNLSIVHGRLGEFDEGMELVRRAHWLFRNAGNEVGAADCRINMGNIALHGGRIDEAETHFKAALANYGALGVQQGVSRSYFSLGMLAHQRRQYRRAESFFLRSLAISREKTFFFDEAKSLVELALVNLEQNFLDAARQYCLQVAGMMLEKESEYLSLRTMRVMMRIFLKTEKMEEALKLAEFLVRYPEVEPDIEAEAREVFDAFRVVIPNLPPVPDGEKSSARQAMLRWMTRVTGNAGYLKSGNNG